MPTWTRLAGFASALLAVTALGGEPSAAQQARPKKSASAARTISEEGQRPPSEAQPPLTPGFTVKPSEVTLPSDVPLGQYRRIIQPFPNWTLICDENFEAKRKICNVAQTILGPSGGMVFSWSLAASQDGHPFFILRVPPSLGENGEVRLNVLDGGPVLPVPVKGCTPQVCIAYQPVGPRLRVALNKGAIVEVSYSAGNPAQDVSFRAPLDGLNKALSGI